MPAGDSGELHYLSLETTSDTSHDAFVCTLNSSYHHTRFFSEELGTTIMRIRFNLTYILKIIVLVLGIQPLRTMRL